MSLPKGFTFKTNRLLSLLIRKIVRNKLNIILILDFDRPH